MKKIIFSAVLTVLTILLSNQLNGQTPEYKTDHLFVPKGGSAVSVATGIPFVFAAEYAYGVSKKFTAGLLFGKIPIPGAQGFGLRLRGILASNNKDLRVYFEMPVVVYPETRKKVRKPWYLVYPSIMSEKRFESGMRLSVGAGLLIGGCLVPVVEEHDMNSHEHQMMVVQKQCVFGGDGGRMAGLWYSFNSGLSLPVTSKITFQQQVNVIAGGIEVGEVTKKDWLYKPSVVIITGLTYSL